MRKFIGIAAVLTGFAAVATPAGSGGAEKNAGRGAYLAAIMDCHGCHTPGALLGKPDPERPLAGSEVGFMLPGVGIFYPPNLTPDAETGLGAWTVAQIVTAIRTGVRPDGRILAPIMPYHSYAVLTDRDAHSLASYLKALKPVRNRVSDPVANGQTAPAPYLAVITPQ
jgi:mono/diheme cytochrome c family protein